MTIQELLKKIKQQGLNDYQLSKELETSFKTPQSTLFRLRAGSHKRTSHERYMAIESVYKNLLKDQK
jgi:hypothetical protein